MRPVEIDLKKSDAETIRLLGEFRRACDHPEECIQFLGSDTPLIVKEKRPEESSSDLAFRGK